MVCGGTALITIPGQGLPPVVVCVSGGEGGRVSSPYQVRGCPQWWCVCQGVEGAGSHYDTRSGAAPSGGVCVRGWRGQGLITIPGQGLPPVVVCVSGGGGGRVSLRYQVRGCPQWWCVCQGVEGAGSHHRTRSGAAPSGGVCVRGWRGQGLITIPGQGLPPVVVCVSGGGGGRVSSPYQVRGCPQWWCVCQRVEGAGSHHCTRSGAAFVLRDSSVQPPNQGLHLR